MNTLLIAAIILTVTGCLAIIADARTTSEGFTLGLTERGIPWRWLPKGTTVAGRYLTAGAFAIFQILGLASGADPFWHVVAGLAVTFLAGMQAITNRREVKRERARRAAGGQAR